MQIEEALQKYCAAQLEKFRSQDAKYSDKSVMRKSVIDVGLGMEELREHLVEEVNEFLAATNVDDAQMEAVDIGNMAFLNWWYMEERLLRKSTRTDVG